MTGAYFTVLLLSHLTRILIFGRVWGNLKSCEVYFNFTDVADQRDHPGKNTLMI